jgi:hypothetical protein
MLEMPTWASFKSSVPRPVARSIAWLAPCDFGSVTREENRLIVLKRRRTVACIRTLFAIFLMVFGLGIHNHFLRP